ncbi:MAG: hypothetical protein JWO36_996 [Myxococcales bacterium]|nr:hypothetical protein [Myxococcales bacterium]
MKSEDGFLDVKLAVITTHPEAWIEGLAAVGDVEVDDDASGWAHKRVCTTAVVGGLKLRVLGYVGNPQSNMQIALVGADRVITDGQTEIPDFSLANPTRFVGPPGKETWLAALKDVLKEAANK